MTHDEAMKLARDVLNCSHNPTHPNWMSMGQLSDAAHQLAKFIFSGDMKREIENAALKLAIVKCEEFAKEQRVYVGQYAYTANAARECSSRISALIQPPAQQKENGE